jgi:serine-type D-Ala-D-Ala carboxypeptidase (penicillin-binding protein 5/6)
VGDLFTWNQKTVLLPMLHAHYLKLLLCLCVLTLSQPAFVTEAQAKSAANPPLEETARAYLLIDAATGEVLRARNPHEPLVPASLTKVMTLRLVFRALENGDIQLSDRVPVSVRAWGGRAPLRGTSLMFLQPGMPVTVEQLIEGMAVASGNDASVALAEHIAGSLSAFVQMMNTEAKRLGLHTAVFHDPHGLSANNRISAADMARLALSMVRDYPLYLDYASRRMMDYNNIKQYSSLRLLGRFDGVDGLKTGFLSNSGYNVAVTAKRDERRLLAVVMGTPRRVLGQRGGQVRDQLAAELLTDGFAFARNVESSSL